MKRSGTVIVNSDGLDGDGCYNYDKSATKLEKSIIAATRQNDIEGLKKILEHREDQKLYGLLLAETAAEYGHVEVFELLRSYGFIDVGNAMHIAASNGHIHVMDYLQHNTLASCSASVMDDAATKGNLEVVKWIFSNRPEGCTAAALIGAAANGHVDVTNFLILNVPSLGQHIQVACDAACKMGRTNVIRYFVNTWSCGCSPTGLDDLAMFGDTNIIEYLLKNAILPPSPYLLLASDLSDEDTSSDHEDDFVFQSMIDCSSNVNTRGGMVRIEYFDNSCVSGSSDDLDADMEEWDITTSQDVSESDCINESFDDNNREYAPQSVINSEDDYDIDDEEDSFDRYIDKKKDVTLTCLFDETGHKVHRNEETRLVTGVDQGENNMIDKDSVGTVSLELNNVDTFRLRSIAGDTRNFETYRQWSPSSWRESIENTVDRIVCNTDRMVMIPFFFEKFGGRNSSAGINKACEAGCLDILIWIHSCFCGNSLICPDRCLFSSRSMEAACRGGQGEIAMWLVNTVHLAVPSPDVAMMATEKGSVSFMEWLYVTCAVELHPDACNLAASSGNCDVLEWLYNFCQARSISFNVTAVDLAAINGHIDVLIFLESIGIKSSTLAADGALMNGHLDIYNHLTVQQGAFPCRYAMKYAALSWPSFSPRLESLIPSREPPLVDIDDSTDE